MKVFNYLYLMMTAAFKKYRYLWRDNPNRLTKIGLVVHSRFIL